MCVSHPRYQIKVFIFLNIRHYSIIHISYPGMPFNKAWYLINKPG